MPRGVRRDDLTADEQQSPGKYVTSGVHVRVVFVAARLAPKRLVLAVVRCGAAANAALLRSEMRIYLDDEDAGRATLFLQPAPELSPAGGEDASAEPGLGSGPIG